MDSPTYQRQLLIQLTLIILVLIGLVGLTWANYRYVVNDRGMNEFTPRWAATRWFMIKGMSPYSPQTIQDILNLVYGDSAERDTAGGRFLYPLFAGVIYVPFALIADQNIARAIWMTLLEMSALGVTAIGIVINRWRPSRVLFAVVLLFPLYWYFSVRAILDGNLVVLCSLWISLAILGIRSGHDNFAGIMLAISMVFYQIIFPLVLLFLVWSASNRRWSVIWSSMISLIFLLVAPVLFLGDWFVQFLGQVINEGDFGSAAGAVISYWVPGVGKQTSRILTALMTAVLLLEWRAMWGKDFRHFIWTACLTLNISFLIGLPFFIEYYVLLIPVLILVLAVWDERWGIIGRILVFLSLLLLIFGIWFAALRVGSRNISPDIDPILVFFTPGFLLFGLYWVKWRAIRKPLLSPEDPTVY